MVSNLLPLFVILLVATLLSRRLERDSLPLRRDQKRVLQALLLLAVLGSVIAYVGQLAAWKPKANSWLIGLLMLAGGGLALWLAQRME
jgi:hypothetical protein